MKFMIYFRINKVLLFLNKLLELLGSLLCAFPPIADLYEFILSILQGEEMIHILSRLFKGIKLVENVNIRYLVAAVLGSTLLAEIARKYTTYATIKVFNINAKPYYKYYSHSRRFKGSICLAVVGYIFEAHLTLLLLMIALVFYCFNVIFIYDYTKKIKEGIKVGYFKYIDNINMKSWSLLSDNKKSIYESSGKLLEELIVYATQTFHNTDVVEKHDTFAFSIEILNEFYRYHIDDKSIGIFLMQLKICLYTIYKQGKDKELFREYYCDILDGVFNTDHTNNSDYDYNIIIAIIFIINELFYQDYFEQNECIEILKKSTFVKSIPSHRYIFLCVYIITFFEVITIGSTNNYKVIIEFCSKVTNINNFTNCEIIEVYNICENVLINIFNYSKVKIEKFNYYYYFIIHYIDIDFYNMYAKYEEELR